MGTWLPLRYPTVFGQGGSLSPSILPWWELLKCWETASSFLKMASLLTPLVPGLL